MWRKGRRVFWATRRRWRRSLTSNSWEGFGILFDRNDGRKGGCFPFGVEVCGWRMVELSG